MTRPIFKHKINYESLNPARWNRKSIRKSLGLFMLITISVISAEFFIYYIFYLDNYSSTGSSPVANEVTADDTDGEVSEAQPASGKCNVSGIELHGNLLTYIPPENLDEEGSVTADQSASERVVSAIARAELDDGIKAILLEIDSYGGSPVAGEEVSNALEKTTKPTIVMVRDAAASAAYFAASGADTIFASKNSDIGSIAVTMSYLDKTRKNQKEGLTYNQLSSGKFKNTGDPDKPLSPDEIKLLMRDIETIHHNFVAAVAENRHLDIKKVEQMADGSTMLGEMALKNGLIDKIGGIFEVKEYLKEKIGEDVKICW